MKIWFLIFDFQRVGQNDGDFDPCSSSTGLQSRSERSAARSVERARAEEEEGSRGRAGDEVLLVQRHQVVRSISGTTTFSNEIFDWLVKKLHCKCLFYLKLLLCIFLVISYCIEKIFNSHLAADKSGRPEPSRPHDSVVAASGRRSSQPAGFGCGFSRNKFWRKEKTTKFGR